MKAVVTAGANSSTLVTAAGHLPHGSPACKRSQVAWEAGTAAYEHGGASASCPMAGTPTSKDSPSA
jgi:hypothetical protein